MGCAPIKSARKKKVNIKRDWASFSRFSTSVQSVSIFKQGSETKVKCLQIKILKKSPKFVLKSINLQKTQLYRESLPVVELIQDTRTVFVDFMVKFHKFCDSVHDVCILNFEFIHGLKVMMLSILGNKQVNLTILKSFPFVAVQGQLHPKSSKILENWQNFSTALENFSRFCEFKFKTEQKKLENFCDVLNEYSGFVLKPYPLMKALKIIESCLKTIKKFTIKAEKMTKDTEEFFSVFDKSSALVEIDEEFLFSGKQIVHLIHS